MGISPLAIAGAVGSVAGGVLSNDANRHQSERNRIFQREMSNTAYQRAVEDMRLAGINPMLAYMQGGASSPSGGAATMQDVISPAVNSAVSASRLTKELQMMESQKTLLQAQSQNQFAQSMASTAEIGVKHQAVRESQARVDALGVLSGQRSSAKALSEAQRRMLEAALPGARMRGSEGATYVDLIRQALLGSGGLVDLAPIRR